MRSESIDSSDIVFYVQVYLERQELLRCWRDVRRIYPTSRLIVCFDGDDQDKSQLEDLYRDPNVEVHNGERLFTAAHGGLVIQRMLELFLCGPGAFLVKIDADTAIKSRIVDLPSVDEPCIYGSLQFDGDFVSVQGGCIIMTRSACELLCASQILKSDALKPPLLKWARSPHTMFRAHSLGLTSHDWVIGYAARELNVSLVSHPGIVSYPGAVPVRAFGRYHRAFAVHPRISSKLGLERILGVFAPGNLWRLLRGEWRTGVDRTSRPEQFRLRFTDFNKSDLPLPVVVWLVRHIEQGASVLHLVDGRTRRELSKFFTTEILDGMISEERLCATSESKLAGAGPYKALILDQLEVELPLAKLSTQINQLDHSAWIVLDDAQLPHRFKWFLCFVIKRPDFRLFFSGDKATIILGPRPIKLRRLIKNTIRLLLALLPLVVRNVLSSQASPKAPY